MKTTNFADVIRHQLSKDPKLAASVQKESNRMDAIEKINDSTVLKLKQLVHSKEYTYDWTATTAVLNCLKNSGENLSLKDIVGLSGEQIDDVIVAVKELVEDGTLVQL